MRAFRSIAVVGGLATACQTRTQATVAAVGTGSLALIGGYVEYRTDRPPISGIAAGTVAIVSAISIFLLGDRPQTLAGDPIGPWQPESRHGASELVAAIQRRGCLGECPVYRVAVYRDGYVHYTGEACVRTVGDAVGHIDPDRLSALEQRLALLPSFRDSYMSYDVTDGPT